MLGVFWKIQEICSKMGTRILKIALEMTEIIDPKVGNPLEKKAKSAIKWYFQNPVCLTFCAVTWSIFHVGRKVRWVLKSSSSGLLKNGQKFFWMCSVTQENNKIEVQTVLLDTLYSEFHSAIFKLFSFLIKSAFPITWLLFCNSRLQYDRMKSRKSCIKVDTSNYIKGIMISFHYISYSTKPYKP